MKKSLSQLGVIALLIVSLQAFGQEKKRSPSNATQIDGNLSITFSGPDAMSAYNQLAQAVSNGAGFVYTDGSAGSINMTSPNISCRRPNGPSVPTNPSVYTCKINMNSQGLLVSQ